MRILMIEDDKNLVMATAKTLRHEGYEVDSALDGDEGLYYLTEGAYDAVLLDRMLPGLSGTELLTIIRGRGISTPVLMLTALGAIDDRVSGLDAGADDYLTKPFDTRELLARIRALVRRPAPLTSTKELRYADLLLDIDSLYLEGNTGRCTLSKKEAELLSALIRDGGKTLPRAKLFALAWGLDAEAMEANLDSYAHFIRRRLKTVSSNVKLITVRGVGYKLEAE